MIVSDLLRLFAEEERGHVFLLVFNSLCTPLAICYLAFMLAEGSSSPGPDVLAVGFTLTFVAAVAQVGSSILSDRFTGRLALLRTTSMPKRDYLASRISLGVFESLIVVGLGLTFVHGLGLCSLRLAPAGLLLLSTAVMSAGMGAVGAFVALRVSNQDTGWAIISLGSLGLALLSPVVYLTSSLPRVLLPLAWLSPYTHIADQFRAALAGNDLPMGSFAGSLVLGLAFGYGCWRQLRWDR